MAELEWQPLGQGYAWGVYRIEPLDNRSRHHWRLTTVGDATPPADYETLSGARAAAVGLERARIRRSRVLTHTVVGIGAGLVAVVSGAVMNDLPTFLIMLAAIWLTSRSFAGAVSEQLGDAWGWTRASGTPSAISARGQAWAGVVDRTRAAVVDHVSVIDSPEGPSDEPKITILPPEPPG